jgi:hypothetical protein
MSSGLDQHKHNSSFQVQSGKNMNKQKKQKIDKKKVLPAKKFPELKLMINGEQRNQNSTLSSDEDNLNVRIDE